MIKKICRRHRAHVRHNYLIPDHPKHGKRENKDAHYIQFQLNPYWTVTWRYYWDEFYKKFNEE